VIEPPELLEEIGYLSRSPVEVDAEDMFWGRLFAADTGEPIGGAIVRHTRSAVVMSDADGIFGYPPPFRSTTVRASVDAVGFATTQFVVDTEHTTRDTALTIVMERGATLAAHVVDAGGEPAPGIRVQVRPTGDDGRWNMQLGGDQTVATDHLVLAAVTGTDGRAEVHGLDPGRGHRVDLIRDRKGGRVLSTPTQVLWVASGERREETFVLPVLGTVRGRMSYEDGAPCAGGLVWILAAKGGGGRYYDREATPLEAANAGSEGEFEFLDVPAGRWVIGPGTPFNVPARQRAKLGFRFSAFPVSGTISVRPSPVAFADARVTVPDPSRGEVAVRTYGGRTLQGVITAEESVSGTMYVFAEPLQDHGLLYTEVGVGGHFTLGPLAPGNVRLRVVITGRGEQALLGASVQPAGASDVRLTVLHSQGGSPEEGRRMFQEAIDLSNTESFSFRLSSR